MIRLRNFAVFGTVIATMVFGTGSLEIVEAGSLPGGSYALVPGLSDWVYFEFGRSCIEREPVQTWNALTGPVLDC